METDPLPPVLSDEFACEGTRLFAYTTLTRQGKATSGSEIIHEGRACIYVNGQEAVSVMCTPCDLEAFALGFLANEGLITTLDDVARIDRSRGDTCVDVWLERGDVALPTSFTLTSCCGGGVTFSDLGRGFPPLVSGKRVTAEALWMLMDRLNDAAALYSRVRGVHTSALSDGERLLLVAEDIGRHNTLDKLRGMALLRSISTRDCVLLATGRISSEMIARARRMEVPIVCSRTSPTSLSAGLAREWNITVVGYLRHNSMNLYTHPERVIAPGMDALSQEG
mgnify:CR=1 FL=1